MTENQYNTFRERIELAVKRKNSKLIIREKLEFAIKNHDLLFYEIEDCDLKSDIYEQDRDLDGNILYPIKEFGHYIRKLDLPYSQSDVFETDEMSHLTKCLMEMDIFVSKDGSVNCDDDLIFQDNQ